MWQWNLNLIANAIAYTILKMQIYPEHAGKLCLGCNQGPVFISEIAPKQCISKKFQNGFFWHGNEVSPSKQSV